VSEKAALEKKDNMGFVTRSVISGRENLQGRSSLRSLGDDDNGKLCSKHGTFMQERGTFNKEHSVLWSDDWARTGVRSKTTADSNVWKKNPNEGKKEQKRLSGIQKKKNMRKG